MTADKHALIVDVDGKKVGLDFFPTRRCNGFTIKGTGTELIIGLLDFVPFGDSFEGRLEVEEHQMQPFARVTLSLEAAINLHQMLGEKVVWLKENVKKIASELD